MMVVVVVVVIVVVVVVVFFVILVVVVVAAGGSSGGGATSWAWSCSTSPVTPARSKYVRNAQEHHPVDNEGVVVVRSFPSGVQPEEADQATAGAVVEVSSGHSLLSSLPRAKGNGDQARLNGAGCSARGCIMECA
jgi:hypothetical protein